MMKGLVAVIAGALALCVALVHAADEKKHPVVNVYTQTPVEFGEKNTLICHCNGFHPPRINITLMRGKEELEGCTKSDMSFERDWTYHISVHVPITPKEGEEYKCVVRHDEGEVKTFNLEIL